jgi:putative N-acetylmannosamine-6-phosphate epimerase
METMKKHISVRLEEDTIKLLAEVAKPFGGVAKWIETTLRDYGKENFLPGVSEVSEKALKGETGKTLITEGRKDEVERAKGWVRMGIETKIASGSVAPHHPTCSCGLCEMKRKEAKCNSK